MTSAKGLPTSPPSLGFLRMVAGLSSAKHWDSRAVTSMGELRDIKGGGAAGQQHFWDGDGTGGMDDDTSGMEDVGQHQWNGGRQQWDSTDGMEKGAGRMGDDTAGMENSTGGIGEWYWWDGG